VAAASTSRIRPLGRGTPVGGIAITVLLHAGLAGLIYYSHYLQPPPPEAPRDMIVTKLVALGKPREKFWLPRIVAPPKPKAPAPVLKVTDDPNAAPAVKEAPKIDDAETSKELKKALRRAQLLAQANVPEEPPEGSLTGSPQGTATEGVEGDAYATQLNEEIKRNWSTPTGLVTDQELQTLEATVRLSIRPDGTLANPTVRRSSGNPYFDDSCIQAVKTTGKVTPPPDNLRATFQKGVALKFRGSDLAR
jgi:TonB family protein